MFDLDFNLVEMSGTRYLFDYFLKFLFSNARFLSHLLVFWSILGWADGYRIWGVGILLRFGSRWELSKNHLLCMTEIFDAETTGRKEEMMDDLAKSSRWVFPSQHTSISTHNLLFILLF